MDSKPVREETIPTLLNRLNAKDKGDQKLKKACNDFEAVFLSFMMKSMRKTVTEDKPGVIGNQRDIYDSLFEQQLSTQISQSRKSFGIGQALYRELSKRRMAEDQKNHPQDIMPEKMKPDNTTDIMIDNMQNLKK